MSGRVLGLGGTLAGGSPQDWLVAVKHPIDEESTTEIRLSLVKGTPLGTTYRTANIPGRLGIESSLGQRGRPRKEPTGSS